MPGMGTLVGMPVLLRCVPLLFCLVASSLLAQAPAPLPVPPKTSVNPDGSITFRYTNAGAKSVSVETDALPKPAPLTRGDDGVWTLTTPPLTPEHYGYSFVVDRIGQRDPLNLAVRPNIVSLSSDILVPATPAAPWEATAIPHGRVDRHRFTTHIAQHLPQNQSAYVVYTPPGYDPRRKGGYPVFYLLHGWSDNETGWTAVGQADLILDRMLADGQIVPMIVVMPLGYGDFDFVTTGFNVWQDAAKVDSNVDLYSRMVLGEVMPAVDREYNIAPGRQNHAIAGLSMGGLESLTIGLQHSDVFAWVGGFSSAVHQEKFDEHFAALDARKANLRLLWVACGTEDGLIKPNRDFVTWAKEKALPITPIETPGQHTWLVWRDNLLHFAPLLFRGSDK